MAGGKGRQVGRGKPMQGLLGHGGSVEFLLEAGAGIEVFHQGKGMICSKR